ncbi:MAG TPA: cytochrome c biogenesis protein CcdA [Actinomycetota bacterium]|nr:cytochrome c biogenesis protein CcdA [Actinomycetota bacterium]
MAADAASVGFGIALIAGAASFLSPCVLPLLPGYLSYMSGMSLEMVRAGSAPARKLLVPTLLFVAGFSTIFVALGTSASLAGTFLREHQLLLSRVAGVLIVAMGLAFVGLLPLPFLYREKRLDMRTGRTLAGNYLMGLSFGLGWTPCIGPTLGATLLIASQAERVGEGALLLLVYSLGLGIPFVLSALGVSRLTGALDFFRRHQQAILRTSGGLLIGFGVLLFFNRVYVISAWIQRWMDAAGLEELIGL